MKTFMDYEKEGTLLFRIGNVSFTQAKLPLKAHHHGRYTEFVFLVRGTQSYQVGEHVYRIFGGEVFTAFPGEWHSTGGYPEEKAAFYYLIVDLKSFCQKEYGCLKAEEAGLLTALMAKDHRIRNMQECYLSLCAKLFQLCGKQALFRETEIRNTLSFLLTTLAAPKDPVGFIQKDKNLEQVIKHIQEHQEEEISLDKLASVYGTSVSCFKTDFLKKTGFPPREFILRKKLESCRKELATSPCTITEIAYKYGFSSSQYFSTVFKRYYNLTPSCYRKQASQTRENQKEPI